MSKMGLFQKSMPFYIMKHYFPGRKSLSFPRGVVIRYVCPSCKKNYSEKVPALTPQTLRGIPLKRACARCGRTLEIENVIEEKRSDRR
jgi:transposase-like protein